MIFAKWYLHEYLVAIAISYHAKCIQWSKCVYANQVPAWPRIQFTYAVVNLTVECLLTARPRYVHLAIVLWSFFSRTRFNERLCHEALLFIRRRDTLLFGVQGVDGNQRYAVAIVLVKGRHVLTRRQLDMAELPRLHYRPRCALCGRGRSVVCRRLVLRHRPLHAEERGVWTPEYGGPEPVTMSGWHGCGWAAIEVDYRGPLVIDCNWAYLETGLAGWYRVCCHRCLDMAVSVEWLAGSGCDWKVTRPPYRPSIRMSAMSVHVRIFLRCSAVHWSTSENSGVIQRTCTRQLIVGWKNQVSHLPVNSSRKWRVFVIQRQCVQWTKFQI